MANTIILKNSSTPASVPLAGNLAAGELAINTADEKIYIKNSSGSVVELIGTVLGTDLGEYTVAGLPSAAANANAHALATDASGGRTLVRSDGTNWKIVVVEGATVS